MRPIHRWPLPVLKVTRQRGKVRPDRVFLQAAVAWALKVIGGAPLHPHPTEGHRGPHPTPTPPRVTGGPSPPSPFQRSTPPLRFLLYILRCEILFL